MVSYLYSFNLFISINEIGKYTNYNIYCITALDTPGTLTKELKGQIGGHLF